MAEALEEEAAAELGQVDLTVRVEVGSEMVVRVVWAELELEKAVLASVEPDRLVAEMAVLLEVVSEAPQDHQGRVVLQLKNFRVRQSQQSRTNIWMVS